MNIWMYYRDFAVPGRVDPGGITKAVTGLAVALAKRSAKVTVLCEVPEPVVTETPGGFELRTFPEHPRTRLLVSAELRTFIKDSAPPDLVVLNGIFSAGVAHVARAVRRRGIPYVHAPHDPYSPAIFARNRHIRVPYWWLIERPLVTRARAIQVLDAKQEQWLRTRRLDVAAITVPNGVFVEDVPDELPWNSPNDRRVRLLFLGRLDAFNKGIDLLIDAVAPLRDQVALTIQGPDTGDGKQLAAQATERDLFVEFLPPDYSTAPSQLIGKHDLLCLPSRFDGFGLTALEAMAAGRVLLVSEEAGIASHVRAGGCGVVVAPTVAAIRGGLEELITRRDEWSCMGRSGRDYVLGNLVWDRIARAALEDYRKLTERSAT